jgi:hypothetical protein
MKLPHPTGDQLKYGVKLSLAVVAAYLVTLGERPQYAFYSVLAAALVIGSNIGENLASSFSRVVGTVLGIGVGVAVYRVAGLSVWSLAAATMLPAVAAYVVGAGSSARIAVTVSVVVMMLSPDAPGEYGLVRVANTLLGAIVGLAVSAAVWPVRAKQEVAVAVDRVLLAAADLLEGWDEERSADDALAARRHLFEELPPLIKARQDERWEAKLWRGDPSVGPTVRSAAGVGVNVLNASLGFDRRPGDLDQATREAVDRAATTLAARLRQAAAGEKLGIEGVADPWAAVEGLAPTEPARAWVMGVFLSLRTADAALIELAQHRGLL